MLVLCIFLLFKYVSCFYGIPLADLLFFSPDITSVQGKADSNEQLRVQAYFERSTNYGQGIEEEIIEFEDGENLTLTCSLNQTKPYFKLQWKVDQYKMETEFSSSYQNISMALTLLRDFDGLKVSCVGDIFEQLLFWTYNHKYITKTLTFRHDKKKTLNIEPSTIIINKQVGEALDSPIGGYHCILVQKKSAKRVYLSGTTIRNISMDQDGSSVFCANLKPSTTAPIFKNAGKFMNFKMEFFQWLVNVTKFTNGPTQETNETHQSDGNDFKNDSNTKDVDFATTVKINDDVTEHTSTERPDKLDIKNVTEKPHKNNSIEDTNSIENLYKETPFSIDIAIYIAVGVIAFLAVLIIITIIVYKFKSKRVDDKLLVNIYKEPQYTEIELQNQGPIPNREENPYTQIIGVMRTRKPTLPPRNGHVNTNSDINKDGAEDPDSMDVVNTAYISADNVRMRSLNLQINMNNYTIMQ